MFPHGHGSAGARSAATPTHRGAGGERPAADRARLEGVADAETPAVRQVGVVGAVEHPAAELHVVRSNFLGLSCGEAATASRDAASRQEGAHEGDT